MKSDQNPKRVVVVIVVAVLILLVILVVIIAVSFNMTPENEKPPVSTANRTVFVNDSQIKRAADPNHIHAALMIFVNGESLDFSDPKYQKKDLLMHFENGDGFTLHKHSRSAWLGPFFKSLNMTLAQNCLVIDNGSSYCTNFDNGIMFLVNGDVNNQFQHYVPKEGDRILVSYGKKDVIDFQQNLLNSVMITR